MQTYHDFERMNAIAEEEADRRRKDCVICPNCSSQWFEQIRVGRYISDHNVILGQNVPNVAGEMAYVLLKCIRCSEMLEPRILHSTRDIGGDAYDGLLDTLEGKEDSREEKESDK